MGHILGKNAGLLPLCMGVLHSCWCICQTGFKVFSPHGCIHSTGSQAWEWGGHLDQAMGGRAGLGDFALEGDRSNSETPPVHRNSPSPDFGCSRVTLSQGWQGVCGHLPQSRNGLSLPQSTRCMAWNLPQSMGQGVVTCRSLIACPW